ncbi:Gag polyprotein [Operophtera brumata]|uniref:Gag polyprotein n=1 Tax=Operophtera brumata TaxID=104452 RepID=A0A0L7LBI8_OPEBR|nr:Gag polyprotein [Operophtera brumata]
MVPQLPTVDTSFVVPQTSVNPQVFANPLTLSNQQAPFIPQKRLLIRTHQSHKILLKGNTCARSFLQKLEEFRLSRNISEEKLCKHAFEIFSDDALHWFKFQYNRNPALTWKNIHYLLIKDFGSYDYDYKLLEAIRKRTQGETETIIIYISVMFGMFARLSKKLSENEQLEILLHNSRPCYSVFIALKDIRTVDDLISTCQTYERFSERDRDFHEPQRDVSSCAYEFAYRPSTSKTTQNMKSSNTISVEKQQLSQNKHKDDYCFRCRVTGHTLTSCRYATKI